MRTKVALLFTAIFLINGLQIPLAAQSNLDVCRVTTDRRFARGGTGIYEISKFEVDDKERGVDKTFKYSTGGVEFTVEVEIEYVGQHYRDLEKNKAEEIRLSLRSYRSSDGANPSATIEAGAHYRRKWGSVFVGQSVADGDETQHFQLYCSDGLSKNVMKRGDSLTLIRRALKK